MTLVALTVRLVHWHAAEAAARADELAGAGLEVDHRVPEGPALLAQLEHQKPDAVVISLDRLPAQGRDLGVALRVRSRTRAIPLVFAGGAAEKVERVRAVLPDAEFTDWKQVAEVVRRVAQSPTAEVVVPDGVFAAYAGRPLIQKLGIREGTVIGMLGAPDDIRTILGPLPAGARLEDGLGSRRDVVLCFVRSATELAERLESVACRLGWTTLWIAWPKKRSALASDLDQQRVRRDGMAAGLVDSKICSVNDTWSGLRFTRRRDTGGSG